MDSLNSGSAQFSRILGERLIALVTDEKKHEAIAAAPPAEATMACARNKPNAKRLNRRDD